MTWRGTMAAPSTGVAAAHATSGPAMHRRPCPAGTARVASWSSGCRQRSLQTLFRVGITGRMMVPNEHAMSHPTSSRQAGRSSGIWSRVVERIREESDAVNVAFRFVGRGVLPFLGCSLRHRGRCANDGSGRCTDDHRGPLHVVLPVVVSQAGSALGSRSCEKCAISVIQLVTRLQRASPPQNAGYLATYWRRSPFKLKLRIRRDTVLQVQPKQRMRVGPVASRSVCETGADPLIRESASLRHRSAPSKAASRTYSQTGHRTGG